MATTTSPMLLSVLSSSSRDNSDDIVVQLRNCLGQIEANVQETLTKIHQRKPYVAFASNNDRPDQQMRNHFFDIIKTVVNNNNLPFDETLFRQQFFEVQQANNNTSPHVDIVREKPSSIIYDTTDQHLSPITNRQRSQFAPVLSSTPVHQTSPITSIPVDLSMATPSVPLAPPVLTVASTHLPPIPPSAIVPQRANVNRAARKPSVDGRPPRAPPAKRAESATRRKRSSPPTKQKEKEDDDDNVIVAKEVRITSKRRVKSKQQTIDIVEESIAVIVEQHEVVAPPIVTTKVQTTPLRSRKKKIVEESKEEIDPIPQLEPPPPPPTVIDEIEPTTTKKTRAGRSKKKEEPIVVIPSHTTEQPKEPVLNLEQLEEVPKKITRARKKNPIVESLNNNEEENPPPARVRATPLRGKKKIDIPSSSKKIVKNTTTNNNKSKKRKNNEDNHDKPMDSIQPPSPKRRAPGRNTKKTADLSSPEPLVTPVSSEQEPPPPTTIRSSRRGKIDLAEEKPSIQQEIEIITKKVRPGRGKKKNEPMAVDLVRTSDTVSVVPTSSIDSLVAKPPRPPVMRKKKSIELPPLPRMSPSTPPPRVQSISPIRHPSLLPIPMPIDGNRPRRQRRAAAAAVLLDTLPSNVENPKRTRSSAIATPKRIRRENLVLTTVPGTPGKKRNKCTCQKRGNKSCDICAVAIDA